MLTVMHGQFYLLIEGVNQKLQPRRVEGSKGERPDCPDVGIHMQYGQAEEADPDHPRQACKQPQNVSENALIAFAVCLFVSMETCVEACKYQLAT